MSATAKRSTVEMLREREQRQLQSRYDTLLERYFALVDELVKLRRDGFNPAITARAPRAAGDIDQEALRRGEAAGIRRSQEEFITNAIADLRSKNPSISEADARREALVLADQAYGSGEPLS